MAEWWGRQSTGMEMIAISRAQKNEGDRKVMTWRTKKGKKGEENYFFCRRQLWPAQFSGRALALSSADSVLCLTCLPVWMNTSNIWASTGKCSGTGYHHVLLIKDEQITPLKAQGFYLLQYLTLVRVLTGVKHQGEDLRLFLHGF